jgi:hypothetical protein
MVASTTIKKLRDRKRVQSVEMGYFSENNTSLHTKVSIGLPLA